MCTQVTESEYINEDTEERNSKLHLPGYLTRIFPTVYSHENDVENDMPMKTPCIRKISIFCTICSIIAHIVDIGFDYNIAIQYLLDDKIVYFAWTLCLIIIPSLINVIISKRMQCQEKEINPSMDNSKISHLMVKNKLCFVIAVILQLAPVLHYCDILKYALKARKCEKSRDRIGAKQNYIKMNREDQDVALLRVFECFLEAAPQQILQLTLILKHYNEVNFLFIHQVASIASSLGSMGWAMASYHRSIRLAQQDKSNISKVGTAFQFLWHFFVTVARILSISVVASIWPISTIICCILHWISMTIWIAMESHGVSEFCKNYSRPPHVKPKFKEYIYSILFASVIGAVYIFVYFNTVDSNTFWKHMFFYILYFLENIICNVVWACTSSPEVRSSWYFNACLVSCALSFFLGIAAMIIYYTTFHPSKKEHTSKISLQIT